MIEKASLPLKESPQGTRPKEPRMRSAALLSLAAIVMLAGCDTNLLGDSTAPAANPAPASAAAPAAPAADTNAQPVKNPAEPDADDASGTAKQATSSEPAGPGTPVNMSADTSLGSDINGLIGDKIATILSSDDRQVAAMAAAQAADLPNAQKITWQGSTNTTQSPATGWAAPVGGVYKDAAGRSCRFVQQSARHGSDSATETVKMCSTSGGWVPS